MNNSGQKGSALFIILIAVALFAALGYAVSNMMRGGSTNIGEETAALRADEIIEYGRKMREAVQNIRISNNCTVTQISFENATVAGYTNAGAPGDDTCNVFEQAGGGLTYIVPETRWLDSSFSGNASYGQMLFNGTVCVDTLPDGDYTTCLSDATDNEELTFFVPFVQQDVCLAINEKLGITNPSGDAPEDVDCSWGGKFTGSYADGGAIGNAVNELDGKLTGCYKQDAACLAMPGSYHYYQVLVVR
ncbi:MAG TPA: hypothetical protein DEA55_02115 [Rhodospirillaceae bacterium]|nr:hypothetical protein [Rhodospirillaceae bacterium]